MKTAVEMTGMRKTSGEVDGEPARWLEAISCTAISAGIMARAKRIALLARSVPPVMGRLSQNAVLPTVASPCTSFETMAARMRRSRKITIRPASTTTAKSSSALLGVPTS
jgi:hypothetical protein